MVKPQDTRNVQAELRKAGFQPVNTVGSHTKWRHPTGVMIPVPDGHNTITPGVYGKILKAIKEAKQRQEQQGK